VRPAQASQRYPDVYEREIAKYRELAKYSGRSHVMRHPVPPLDCTWTDVVFFSPVHLALIFDAIRSSGRINSGPDYWTIECPSPTSRTSCTAAPSPSRFSAPQPGAAL
jgi:hypothetical protein